MSVVLDANALIVLALDRQRASSPRDGGLLRIVKQPSIELIAPAVQPREVVMLAEPPRRPIAHARRRYRRAERAARSK